MSDSGMDRRLPWSTRVETTEAYQRGPACEMVGCLDPGDRLWCRALVDDSRGGHARPSVETASGRTCAKEELTREVNASEGLTG